MNITELGAHGTGQVLLESHGLTIVGYVDRHPRVLQPDGQFEWKARIKMPPFEKLTDDARAIFKATQALAKQLDEIVSNHSDELEAAFRFRVTEHMRTVEEERAAKAEAIKVDHRLGEEGARAITDKVWSRQLRKPRTVIAIDVFLRGEAEPETLAVTYSAANAIGWRWRGRRLHLNDVWNLLVESSHRTSFAQPIGKSNEK